jgi:hypothetical protein
MRLRVLRENLTLEVGGGKMPSVATFKVSGKLLVDDQMLRGDECTLTIANADGEVIAAGTGFVKGINFVTHEETESAPEFVERAHTIKLR